MDLRGARPSPTGLARAPCRERHLARTHPITGTAAYCVLDTDILSLASIAWPASGRGARSLRPLRPHSFGLLLAFLPSAARHPRSGYDLGAGGTGLRRSQRPPSRNLAPEHRELPGSS